MTSRHLQYLFPLPIENSGLSSPAPGSAAVGSIFKAQLGVAKEDKMQASCSMKLCADHDDWFLSRLQGDGAGRLENGCDMAVGRM